MSTSSDLQKASGSALASDAQRQVFTTIEVDLKLRANVETSAAVAGVVSPKNRAYESTVAIRHQVILCVMAGSAGKWYVERICNTLFCMH